MCYYRSPYLRSSTLLFFNKSPQSLASPLCSASLCPFHYLSKPTAFPSSLLIISVLPFFSSPFTPFTYSLLPACMSLSPSCQSLAPCSLTFSSCSNSASLQYLSLFYLVSLWKLLSFLVFFFFPIESLSNAQDPWIEPHTVVSLLQIVCLSYGITNGAYLF